MLRRLPHAGVFYEVSRGLILRAAASFQRRFVTVWSGCPFKLLSLLSMTEEAAQAFALEFWEECASWLDVFSTRLRASLHQPLDLLRPPILAMLKSIAAEGLLLSARHCELQHAQAQAWHCAASTRGRKDVRRVQIPLFLTTWHRAWQRRQARHSPRIQSARPKPRAKRTRRWNDRRAVDGLS